MSFPPVLLDLTHTSHTAARTGIQRLGRAIWEGLGAGGRPICLDPYRGAWRALEPWETANLASQAPSASRGARWPLRARLRGWLARGRPVRPLAGLEPGTAFLCPEIFSPAVSAALPGLFAAIPGPRAALFHDAAAMRHPELASPRMVARYPSYLQELLAFDGIAAISEESRDTLVEYWRWLGVDPTPPVAAIPLGVSLPPPGVEAPGRPPGAAPVVLCVNTIEGRKNHLALVEACETLWSAGVRFELRLIGLARPETARPALERIAALRKAGRPLRFDGPADEAALEAAYAQCAFTVYPSLAEGFGLPIAESLARGRPCVCPGLGAAGELARGGGCLALDVLGPAALASAMGRLLRSPAELSELAEAARSRPVRTWADYVRDLTAWLQTLARRA